VVDVARSPDGGSGATGAERILSSAIAEFGERGVRGVSLKAIAESAGVSPALILHHYGSKDGLRTACDQWVAAAMRRLKTDAVAKGTNLDPVAVASSYDEHRPMMRYLARTLTDGSPHVNDLLDEIVADAQAYSAQAEEAGLMRPSADPRARAALLTVWSMGGLMLHEHLERLLGVDLLGGKGYPARYVRAVMEIYGHGVFTEGAYPAFESIEDVPVAGTDERKQNHE
jgi:AcrR family transcriptional regulator